MSKILIAGHSGFIGSKLKDFLNESNLSYVTLSSNLLDTESVEKEISTFEKIDTLVFLVGAVGTNLNSLINTNLITLSNLLSILIKKDLKNVIFTSTGGVYGEPKNNISFEEDLLQPNSFYGLSKKYSEDLLEYYCLNFGINVFILRFPNVYGPGNRKGVIYNFLKSIKYQKKVYLEGTGNEKRNFLYVDDAVKSILLILNLLPKNKFVNKFNVYNISTDELFSLNQLIEKLKKNNFDFEISNYSTNNENTIKVISLNNDKFQKDFDWKPAISLENGLIKTIEEDYSKI